MKAAGSIARLRHQMMLQRPEDIPDAVGGFARSWLDVATIWTALETLAAGPDFEAAQHVVRSTHRITIRWRPDLTGAMRLVGSAGTFIIHAAHDADGKHAFMRLYCERLQT